MPAKFITAPAPHQVIFLYHEKSKGKAPLIKTLFIQFFLLLLSFVSTLVTMLIRDLPLEIISQIFQLLPRSDLYKCLTLCQAWFLSALEEYYREFALSEHNALILQERFIQQAQDGYCVAQLDFIGPWVKKITIVNNESTYSKLLHPQIITFFSYFPNLKILEFTQTNDFQWYIEAMALCEDTEKYWPHLQDIVLPYKANVTAEVMKLYFPICYRLRASITNLFIHHPQTRHTIGIEAGNYLQFLPDFKKLTHLVIYNYNYYAADRDLLMFQILEACPNLIEYQMGTDMDIENSEADVFLLTLDEKYNKGGAAAIINKNRKFHQPLYKMQHLNTFHNIHLRHLYLELPVMKRAYMSYIMSYVAAHQLDTFGLAMQSDDFCFDDWMMQGRDKSATTVLEFANHLNSVKNFTIFINHNKDRELASNSSDISNEMRVKAKGAFFNEKLERFWKFVAAIKGNRKLVCHANLNYTDFETTTESFAKFEVKDNQKLILEYTFTIDQYLVEQENVTIPLLSGNIGRDIVNLLSTYIVNNKYVLKKTKKAEMLHSVLTSFTRLTQLHLNFPYAPQSRLMFTNSNNIQNINNSLALAKSASTTTTAENFTHAKILYPSLTPDLFETIASDLPHLKTIQYTGYRFEYDENNNATLDLHYIKDLDHLELLLSDFKFKQFQRVFVMLKYQQDELSRLYVTGDLNGDTRQTYTLLMADDKDTIDQSIEYFQDTLSLFVKIECGGHIRRLTLVDIFENNTFEVVAEGPKLLSNHNDKDIHN